MILALLIAVFGFVCRAGASIRWATLEAIHRLENPRDLTQPGPRGELGAYQFRNLTWRMHTTLPFERALDRQVSDTVALKHYDWLKRGLEKASMPATPYNIALAWNGGLSAAITGTSPRVAHTYACRAANLAVMFDQNSQQVADAR